jgi:phosphoribosylaminoimidazolecarboxamide formyltransferase/IMP cyclohydrolase
MPIRRALVSVSDKTGIVELGRALAAGGVEILSTGGSARALAEAGVPVREVSAHTGFPEILDGRVKTLHPKIHGGLLARRDHAAHLEAMTDYGIAPIDLLAVNLYPFERTIAGGADEAAAIEAIDIGGTALIRAAAKNHAFVTVVTDPADYPRVLDDIAANGGAVSEELRRELAAAAFARTAAYDAAIAGWFAGRLGDAFPPRMALDARLARPLRYGENPHQEAALYHISEARPGIASARQVQGREPGWNNLNDADAAIELVAELDRPAVAIVKHANPCGVAEGAGLAEAFARALACDPVSAYGGIIAANRPLTAEAAAAIAGIFSEVVIAPDADPAALEILAARRNLRVLLTGAMPDPAAPGLQIRSVAGGLLVQDRDDARTGADALKVVTRRAPTPEETEDLLFAFRIAKHARSNAIVLARGRATVGIGAGQPSRLDSARLAVMKAAEAARAAGETTSRTAGSVVASDAFFPFADALEVAIAAGATAAIQPGGSLRDAEVIEAADRAGITMVFTGTRHFRH